MRISKKLSDSILSEFSKLDGNVKDKCSLCNIQLTDVVLSISNSLGAPIRTVCDVIAKEINSGRPSYDRVSKDALRKRVERIAGVSDTVKPSPARRRKKDKYAELLKYCEKCEHRLKASKLEEEIKQLKEEIARLKNDQPKPFPSF